MNYFKSAEQVLYSVPTLKRAVENLENRRAKLIANGAPREPGAIDYSKPFTDTHYVNDTLNEMLEVAECTRNIAETQKTLSYIEGVITQLDKEQKEIIEAWYIEHRTKEEIAERLCVAITTAYSLRNKAVAEFALLYYGSAALSSI